MNRKSALSAVIIAAALAVPAEVAHAAGATSASFPISAFATIPCAGDTVLVSGTAHVVLRQAQDANGGTHFVLVANYEGLQGTSSDGAAYVGITHEVTSSYNFDPFVGPPYNLTFNELTKFVGKGSAPTFTVKTLNQVTVNAAGELTSQRTTTDVTCT
jgi:hypothetical protein